MPCRLWIKMRIDVTYQLESHHHPLIFRKNAIKVRNIISLGSWKSLKKWPPGEEAERPEPGGERAESLSEWAARAQVAERLAELGEVRTEGEGNLKLLNCWSLNRGRKSRVDTSEKRQKDWRQESWEPKRVSGMCRGNRAATRARISEKRGQRESVGDRELGEAESLRL